ncbi:MAG: SpoIIE family protein phosphatase [Bacteroidales bacterium]|nr:SpoIIE family protein phosphatase [Bacteroidales bacterium]
MNKILVVFITFFLFAKNFAYTQTLPDSLQGKLSAKSPKEQVAYLLKIANDNLKKNASVSFELAKTANEIAIKNADKNNEVTTSLLIAKSSRQIGKSQEGLDYITKAIQILTQANQKQYLALAYNEQGLLYKDLNKHSDAANAFQRCANIYEELNDKKNLYLVLGNLGAAYDKAKQNKQAITIFQKAKTIAEELGDKKEIALATMQLGVAYANYGNTKEALNVLNSAKEIANSIGNVALANQIQTNIDNLNQKLAVKDKTEFEKEKEREQEQYISSLKTEYEQIKLQSLKTFEEIEKLKIEDQAKEYRLRAIQGEYEKQLLENKMKEQNLKLLEAEKKQKDAEIMRQNETLAYQKRVLLIVGVSLAVVIILLLLVIRLYLSNKRTLNLVRQQKVQIERQKDEIELINKELAHQNTIIRESIDYAKHIQLAILPSINTIRKYLPDFFVFLKPRDVISGDFYWFNHINNKSIIATVDCTGHGVPGAFMSLIAYSLLNKIIKEYQITDPAQILSQLNKEVLETMSQSGDELDNSMDISICKVDHSTNEVYIAMAGHSCIYITPSKKIEELDGKDYAIGGVFAELNAEYKNFIVKADKNTAFYFYSDGFPDQVGGAEKKKLGNKAFVGILVKTNEIEPSQRAQYLEQALVEWKGDKKQVDDIIVIGFNI